MNAVLTNVFTEDSQERRVGKRSLLRSVDVNSNELILLPIYAKGDGLLRWNTPEPPTARYLNFGLKIVF